MDSETRLDYALFQLTPTRTRCDLVILHGGTREKLASGLFQPFVSHLKFAKDEISKGGYSITLRPPSKDASWFTKSTFERFVRFVSTPEVLERFINLEKEILQIESSLQANELDIANVAGQGEQGNPPAGNGAVIKSLDSSKLQSETGETDDSPLEENSRLHLQRVLESRKAVLLKSQAMAFARGRAAGFEIDSIDELISFADAFGASRLREACLEFKILCVKKQADGPWMEELSAMEAYASSELSFPVTSGIVLANDMNASTQSITLHYSSGDGSSDTAVANGSSGASNFETGLGYASVDGRKDDNASGAPSANAQMQIPWPHQMPQYMYPVQQMPPYQAYPFPMMPHNLNNGQWPFNSDASYPDLKQEKKNNYKPYSEKKKKTSQKEAGSSSEEETDSSDGGDSDLAVEQEKRPPSVDVNHRRKHKKKSSRTVVIRNINYITSKGKDGDANEDSAESSSADDDFIEGHTLKQSVQDAVESLKKSHKSKRTINKKKEDNGLNLGNEVYDDDRGHEDDQPSPLKKTNENWDTFQSLLMTPNDETHHPKNSGEEQSVLRSFGDESLVMATRIIELGMEKVGIKLKTADDSFVLTDTTHRTDSVITPVDFSNTENLRPGLKRTDYSDEALLISGGTDESGNIITESHIADANVSLTRLGKGEDSFIVNHMGKLENGDASLKGMIFDGDYVSSVNNQSLGHGKVKGDRILDDSIMIQSRSSVDAVYDDFHLTRDITMVAEFTSAVQTDNCLSDTSEDNRGVSKSFEPDDLFMMLERDSEVEPAKRSWSMDSAIDISLVENDRCSRNETCDDANDKNTLDGEKADVKKVQAKKEPGKEAKSRVVQRPVGTSRLEPITKTKKPSPITRSTIQKSKLEKEDEIRRRIEEMQIQRQKRIAERTAASGLTPASRKPPTDSKISKAPVKIDKGRTPPTGRDVSRVNPENRALRV